MKTQQTISTFIALSAIVLGLIVGINTNQTYHKTTSHLTTQKTHI